ncbi:MAG TPA: CdaR family protein [Kofleriaceae bacterium]|nr:CdaR family protein [Kofleriaceae bacterium]
MKLDRDRDRTRRTRPELAAIGGEAQRPQGVARRLAQAARGPGQGGQGGPGGDRQRTMSAALLAWLRGALLDNAPLKFVAMVLALTVFILVHANDQEVAGGTIDVTYLLPEDRVLVSERPDQLRVTVKGSRRVIKRFHREELKAIQIDLRNTTRGEVFFQPDMIDLPDGLELVSISPGSMQVVFEQLAVKSVPIAVDITGAPDRGFRVDSMTPRPSQVTIRGAMSLVAETRAVRTAEIDVARRNKSFRETARLAPPPGLVVDGNPVVEVDVTLAEEQGSRELSLPVAIQPGPGLSAEQAAKISAHPGQVRVILRGSVLVIDELRAENITAYVRVSQSDLSGNTARTAPVRVEPALPGIGYEISPAEVTLRPTP